ncbi:MAG: hypothetical protein ACRD03_09595 [Acidimicrobiales bacterium]
MLVPWDLSEIDATGAVIEGGGDDNAGAIALIAVVVLAIALALLLARPTRGHPARFTLGGYVTWAALFGWRAGSARFSGANLYIVPLVVIVIPVAVAVPLLIRSLSKRRTVSS